MAIRGIRFKWYDGFFLSMLAFSIVMVLLSWKRYYPCKFPLHLWIVVDYGAVFVFRILMFVDNGLSARMGLDFGQQQRDYLFLGRVVVLSILYVVLYPFLWAWSITGSIWFRSAQTCLPEKNQKWGFLVWLIFSYCGLVCLAVYLVNKWLTRRKAHLARAQGIPISGISEYGVLVDMIRLPDWVFESAAQEMRIMEEDDDTPHHIGFYLSDAQKLQLDKLIEELPLFSLKAIPTDCSDCPICLEEFHVGVEVRGLPCAHYFHAACIDKWLRLSIRCPRCRCTVFPNLQPTDPPNIPQVPNRSTTIHHVESQPISHSYLSRMQSFFMPIRSGDAESSNANANSNSNSNSNSNTNTNTNTNTSTNANVNTSTSPNINNHSHVALEITENEDQPSESHDLHTSEEHVR